jgi:hypothetical protein
VQERIAARTFFEKSEGEYGNRDEAWAWKSFACYGTIGVLLSLPILILIWLLVIQFGWAYLALIAICSGIVFGVAGVVRDLIELKSLYRSITQRAEDIRHDIENGAVIEYSGIIQKAWYEEGSCRPEYSDMRIRFDGGDEVVIPWEDHYRLGLIQLPTGTIRLAMLPRTRTYVSTALDGITINELSRPIDAVQ